MPDYSMCKNEKCPLKEKCYRYTATPNEHRQAYTDYDEKNCQSFKDNQVYKQLKRK
jgi:hypothetical protein